MRDLTQAQKNLLKSELKRKNKRDKMGELWLSIYSVDDLSLEVWHKLNDLNESEVLYQNCNIFIRDYNANLINE